ncbi:RNA-binding cell elongation regulator Jag/EloR [[Clostridium] fimetarium]|uniref:RNA-binding protein KhpB n=1 Tax=[Clostridium] fimetarium TaxID=99656 RepID=A0A1I0QSU9_9FIRM|nr:RNA-binding cell elongation regulator Jag/EloR [[Clostridium] fimetarium]SEW30006.1 spoIIIJ-associated protein [[Clostridium] fimetarium]
MEFIEVSGKTLDEALTNALLKLETTSDKVEFEVIDKGSNGILSIFNYKPAKIKVRKKNTIEDLIREFLENMFNAMNMAVKVDIVLDNEECTLDVELSGEDMGLLIGKRGQTLDSIQYLVSLVANKEKEKYIRVKVDTENYRQRRKETLESLAKNISYKVKRSKRSVSLEPMNPYERRIIHSALQTDKFVSTKSEGEDPFRHVVIFLKPTYIK